MKEEKKTKRRKKQTKHIIVCIDICASPRSSGEVGTKAKERLFENMTHSLWGGKMLKRNAVEIVS